MTPRRSGELPPDAAARLRAAAAIADPRERQRAIDRASAWARVNYPQSHRNERANMKVNINNVRMAFPSIFEASSFEGGDPKFGGKWVIEPTDKANIEKLDDAMLAVAKEKWGAKAEKIFEGLTKTGKKPEVPFVREGYKNRDGDTYAGFEDNFYLTANSATRPLIIDRDKSPLIASDGKPYAGCYVNVQVEIWAQDNSFGRAIRAQLKGIQFYRDGDAFSGGAPANPDDFDDLGSQGDDSDLA